jgi:hypothetical protein
MRVWVLLAAVLSLPVHAADTLPQLFDCMRGNIPQTLRIQDVQLDAVDRSGGSRVLRGRLYAKREDGMVRVMLRVAEPVQVAGAAYLVRESAAGDDDMYIFLPSVGRVRRVTGDFTNGALLGTDFSYAEIKLVQNAFTGAEGREEAADRIDGRAVRVFSLRPAKQEASVYSAVRVWVDQQTCVALKAEFYAGDAPRKRLSAPASALRQSGKLWYLDQMEMRDLREETYTVLKVQGITTEPDLGSRYFNPSSFHLGK